MEKEEGLRTTTDSGDVRGMLMSTYLGPLGKSFSSSIIIIHKLSYWLMHALEYCLIR